MEIGLMNAEAILREEIKSLEREFGAKAKLRLCRNLTAVVRWVRESGHGNVTLSAVDHLLGPKIRTETIITATED